MADAQATLDDAARGIEHAWDALVRQHNQRLIVWMLSRGVSIDRAKELAQETWMRLLTQSRAGKLRRVVMPGLAFSQAEFLIREDRRRSGVERVATDWPDNLHDDAPDPEQRALIRDELSRALDELHRCGTSAQRVFRLLYGSSKALTQAEVGRKLGLSEQRVRQIACEIRSRVRRIIESDDDE